MKPSAISHQLSARPAHAVRRAGYPTRFEVQARPGLLERHVPPAWLGRREMAGTLSLVLGAAAGCGSSSTVGGAATLDAARVAPVFVHGKGLAESLSPQVGVGMLGCIAVAAPTYLPEDEAFAVIADELAKVGVNLTARNVPLQSVVIRGHVHHSGLNWISGQPGSEVETVAGPLVANAADLQRHVFVEFVSQADFCVLGGDDAITPEVDLKQAATLAGTAVASHARGIWFGAFYDPVEYYRFGEGRDPNQDQPVTSQPGESEEQWLARAIEARFQRDEAKGRERAKAQLRAQVLDFVDWLKAQGAI